MAASKNETFGLIKTLVDAHTMGIHAAAALLRDCGYRVLISPKQRALRKLSLIGLMKTTFSALAFLTALTRILLLNLWDALFIF